MVYDNDSLNILGLGLGASEHETKLAYWRLALIFHPDKWEHSHHTIGMTLPETTAHSQLLNNAQSFLRSWLWTWPCTNDALPPKKEIFWIPRKMQESSRISYQFRYFFHWRCSILTIGTNDLPHQKRTSTHTLNHDCSHTPSHKLHEHDKMSTTTPLTYQCQHPHWKGGWLKPAILHAQYLVL